VSNSKKIFENRLRSVKVMNKNVTNIVDSQFLFSAVVIFDNFTPFLLISTLCEIIGKLSCNN